MAGMGNSRHLATGSTRPDPPAKDVLRVYGMKFCPYVHRLKLVLAKKGIKHETVNINLKQKPEWYFDINPRGKVPSIEKNGVILYESDITSNYVDEVFEEGGRLTTADPLKRAQEMIVLGYFGDAVSGYYGTLRAKDDETKAELFKKIKENVGRVIAFLEKNGTPYICGDKPGMTDYMVWPHLERMSIFNPDAIKSATLKAYIDRMEQDDGVKACRHSNELHEQFFKMMMGGEYNYDIGTVDN